MGATHGDEPSLYARPRCGADFCRGELWAHFGASYAGAFASRAGRRRVADEMIDVILQPGAPQFEFFNFLIRREINFLFDAVNRVIEAMIFVEHFPEVVVHAFEAADDIAMFRKLSQDRMMEVHGYVSVLMDETGDLG
jgi:hypothetical protein